MSKITIPPPRKKRDLGAALYEPPSLVPGVEYPTTEREERLLDLAYAKGCADTLRVNRSGRAVEDDPLLDYMRKEVERIRTEELGYD